MQDPPRCLQSVKLLGTIENQIQNGHDHFQFHSDEAHLLTSVATFRSHVICIAQAGLGRQIVRRALAFEYAETALSATRLGRFHRQVFHREPG